jgi:hypothetical protein
MTPLIMFSCESMAKYPKKSSLFKIELEYEIFFNILNTKKDSNLL